MLAKRSEVPPARGARAGAVRPAAWPRWSAGWQLQRRDQSSMGRLRRVTLARFGAEVEGGLAGHGVQAGWSKFRRIEFDDGFEKGGDGGAVIGLAAQRSNGSKSNKPALKRGRIQV
jgi:hypothetical protein